MMYKLSEIVDYVPAPILTPGGIARMKKTIDIMRMTYPGIVTASLQAGWEIQTIDDHVEQKFDHARLGNANPIHLVDWPLMESLINNWGIKYERKIATIMFEIEEKKGAMRTQAALGKVYEKFIPAELTGKKRSAS